MAALPAENGAVGLMSNDKRCHFLSSLIQSWIMVAIRRYKSHLSGDKLEMVSNGFGNQNSYTETQNM